MSNSIPLNGPIQPNGPFAAAIGPVQQLQQGTRFKIYVRTGGNDSTGDGKSPATAYRTIPRAFADVPVVKNRDDNYVIDITGINDTIETSIRVPPIAGGHTWYDQFLPEAPEFPCFTVEGDVTLQALPQLQVALNPGTTTQVVDDVTGNVVITDTSQSWTANQWQGLICLSSDQTDNRTIIENGTDWIRVSNDGEVSAPAIYDYGATLTGADFIDVLIINDHTAGVVAVNGVRINSSSVAGTALLCAAPECDVVAAAAWFETFEGLTLGAIRFIGVVIESDLDLESVSNSNLFVGLLLNLAFSPYVTLLLITGGIVNSTFVIEPQEETYRAIWLSQIDIIASEIDVYNGVTTFSDLKFRDCPSDCVNVHPLGLAAFFNGVRDAGGNAGYGLVVQPGGQATYQSADPPTITGTNGDTKVGSLATRTWADLQANDPVGLQADVFGGFASLSSDVTVAAMPVSSGTSSALPAASAAVRGQVRTVLGGDGVADVAYVCVKSAGGTYSWVQVATG